MARRKGKKKGGRRKQAARVAQAAPLEGGDGEGATAERGETTVAGSREAVPAAAASRERPSAARGMVLKKRKGPNWPLLGLALAGMALSGYLTATSWFGAEPLYCGEGSTCDIVQSSRWGTFLDIPTAFWGFLTYFALAYVAYRIRNAEWHWKSAWTISLIGLGYSAYLTVISLTVIEAACVYCLASLTLLGAIFAVTAFQRPAGLANFSWPSWAGQTAVLALAVAGGMHLHYSGVFSASAGPEDPYLKALANHLSQTEAIFYGAYW